MHKITLTRISSIGKVSKIKINKIAAAIGLGLCDLRCRDGAAFAGGGHDTRNHKEHHEEHHEEHHRGNDYGYVAPVPSYYYAPAPNYYYAPEPEYYPPQPVYSQPPPSEGINLFFGRWKDSV